MDNNNSLLWRNFIYTKRQLFTSWCFKQTCYKHYFYDDTSTAKDHLGI